MAPAMGQAQGVTVQGGVYYNQPGYQQGYQQQQQPVYQQQQGYQQQTYVQQQPQAQYVEDLPRLRFALTGGAVLGGGAFGTLAVEGTIQLGVQLNDLLGIYYRGRGQIGFIWDRGGSIGLYASIFNPILIDVTLGDFFQVGAGPSLDYLVYSACNSFGGGTVCVDRGVLGFAGDARIAISIPHYQGRQSVLVGMSRGGYTFELNGHFGVYGFDTGTFGMAQVGIAGGWILY
jgi:hypothetical protein